MSKLNWQFLNKQTDQEVEKVNKQLGLVTFNKRKNITPFNKLSDDEKIIAHYGLLRKELLKSCLESFYEYQLDDINFERQLNCLTRDKMGGINYYNYMFSDSYDDEDRKTDKPLGPGMENYAVLSIREAIEKYWPVAAGWEDCVMMMGYWYEKNVHTYQGDPKGVNAGDKHSFNVHYECNMFPEPYENHFVRDDCTGYCTACLLFYLATSLYETDPDLVDEIMKAFAWPPSSELWTMQDGAAQKLTEKCGFEILPYSLETVQPFDIMMGNPKTGNCSRNHGEIYAGNFGGRHRSWAWGSVHDKEHGGMPSGMAMCNYDWIFRMKGITKYTDKEAEEMAEDARQRMIIPDAEPKSGKN